MANEIVAKKQPNLQQRIAERQAKRVEVGKEAQVRVAAAWTIAKTMLPTAPSAIQKKFAITLLGASTKVLKAALRQTAVNAHYTKIAETLKEVHKIEMNALMEDPSILSKNRNEIKSELKGDSKAANAKTADDREAAGPQKGKYDEGDRKSPDRMDADHAAERKEDTVDKTEGKDTKTLDAVQDSAREEVTGKAAAAKNADAPGMAPKPVSSPAPAALPAKPAVSSTPAAAAPNPIADSKAEIRASAKTAHGKDCDCAECKKMHAKESNFGESGKHNEKLEQTRTDGAAEGGKAPMPTAPSSEKPRYSMASKAKTAQPIPGEGMETTAPAGDMGGSEPAAGPGPEAEAPAEALAQDDTLESLKEHVEEAQQDVQQLEQELGAEKNEELDLTGLGEATLGEEPMESDMDMQDIFSPENMESHASNLANEHHESSDDDFFGPSASSDLEASLDEAQLASFDDMFSHEASSDPLAGLFGKEANVGIDGHDVVPSNTGEAAKKFQAEHGKEDRDAATDHDEDILSLLVEGLHEEDNDQVRVKQDATPDLETPDKKAAAAKKPVLKHIKASAGTPAPKVATEDNIADLLFSSIDAHDELRNNSYARTPKVIRRRPDGSIM